MLGVESDPQKRKRGLEMMSEVYGWEFKDGPGDFYGYTVEHLFADIWQRPGLTMRDRRLLLLGLLVGSGLYDVVPIQLQAALTNGELDEESARELVVFLAHYAGWPAGAKLNSLVEDELGKTKRN
ncbi:MAG: 4-carboxymuconolactone decarboxylase [Frankiales bacterium]|jgi:4-carboxymuconolactone decarboxylase|nr:4-carboxymuconolactone decarboxylase [Frankiales bacterium]